jgi:hypothetical protein
MFVGLDQGISLDESLMLVGTARSAGPINTSADEPGPITYNGLQADE